MYAKTLQNLIELFSKFPGVGPKTAARFVFYLRQRKNEEINELVRAILALKEKLKTCRFCFNVFEGSGQLCPICSNPTRRKTTLLVVEKETDLAALEAAAAYRGLYFVLGGTVSHLKKDEVKKLKTEELKARIKNPSQFGLSRASFDEIILAISPTVEGEATALYLERKLKDLNKKISRLGRGLPIGGELEYADAETLKSALEGRK